MYFMNYVWSNNRVNILTDH